MRPAAQESAPESSSSPTTRAEAAVRRDSGGSFGTSAMTKWRYSVAGSVPGRARSDRARRASSTGSSCRGPRNGDTISAEELQARLGEPGLVVLDARAPERYRGEAEPIDPVAGRIPGALNMAFAAGAQPPAEALEAPEVVAYCGSGITACGVLLELAEAGRPDAKLYAGSWSDWISRELPAERG